MFAIGWLLCLVVLTLIVVLAVACVIVWYNGRNAQAPQPGNTPPMAPATPLLTPGPLPRGANRIRFQNDSTRDWKVICEPTGDERVLPPKGSTTLVLGDGEVVLDVVQQDDAVVVHVEKPQSADFSDVV